MVFVVCSLITQKGIFSYLGRTHKCNAWSRTMWIDTGKGYFFCRNCIFTFLHVFVLHVLFFFFILILVYFPITHQTFLYQVKSGSVESEVEKCNLTKVKKNVIIYQDRVIFFLHVCFYVFAVFDVFCMFCFYVFVVLDFFCCCVPVYIQSTATASFIRMYFCFKILCFVYFFGFIYFLGILIL